MLELIVITLTVFVVCFALFFLVLGGLMFSMRRWRRCPSCGMYYHTIGNRTSEEPVGVEITSMRCGECSE